jgi:hypothetical protein
MGISGAPTITQTEFLKLHGKRQQETDKDICFVAIEFFIYIYIYINQLMVNMHGNCCNPYLKG